MNRVNTVAISIVLGLLSAVGPFAIDMYLPALPSIGHYFGASSGAAQASLGIFFLTFGSSQLVYGPLSDRFGRRSPLFTGLTLFLIGSIGCALASSIEMLIAFRFVQGFGAGAMAVIPRAMVRDLFTGVEAARMMARLTLVFSVSPILAPLSGSLLIQHFPWPAIFVCTALIAILGMVLTRLCLPETHSVRPASNGRPFRAYLTLLRDSRFVLLVAIGALGTAAFFVYLAGSSFVLIGHYHLSPSQFSLAFSANAFSLIFCSVNSARLAARFGLPQVLRGAVLGHALIMCTVWLYSAVSDPQLPIMLGLLFIGYGFLGLVLPCTTVLAMDAHGAHAGAASALLGTLQLGTGAVVIALISPFSNGAPLPMLSGIALCSLLSLTVATVAGRRGYLQADIVRA